MRGDLRFKLDTIRRNHGLVVLILPGKIAQIKFPL